MFKCRENDVAGIDINMGCPKDYSTKVFDFVTNAIYYDAVYLLNQYKTGAVHGKF